MQNILMTALVFAFLCCLYTFLTVMTMLALRAFHIQASLIVCENAWIAVAVIGRIYNDVKSK